MPEEKGLNSTTITFMIVVALIYDAIQIVIQLIPFAGQIFAQLINIFAFLTFFVWFKIHGVSFSRPKRWLTFGGGSVLEFMSIGILPTWTLAVLVVSLDSRIKKIVPGLDIIKK